jgi:prepilin-type N-terminal cleavage/methylation domain-containing protein
MHRLLSPRAGFTLPEVMVALVLTAVIGGAVTSVFVNQSRFYDRQEKVSFARGVSRGAMNMIMSELRMLEQDSGVVAATNQSITLRVPYALGVVCGSSGAGLIISQLPTDTVMNSYAGHTGYAIRGENGTYRYRLSSEKPAAGGPTGQTVCTDNQITVIPTVGRVVRLSPEPATTPQPGTAVFIYQLVTYTFKASLDVPGRIGLFRRMDDKTGDNEDELVAPFDTTAKFRFFVRDSVAARDDPPAELRQITGIELVLDGLSERPDGDGSFPRVPMTTAVFFRNRQ